MKHYDKSSGVAVTEWRNALHQARQDQHLPLLYVANEGECNQIILEVLLRYWT